MSVFSEDRRIYTGKNEIIPPEIKDPDNKDLTKKWPDPPSWREKKGILLDTNSPEYKEFEELEKPDQYLYSKHGDYRPFKVYESQADDGSDVIDAVNMAIYLRRPLLVTGDTGIGKTSLAYDIAYELRLGKVLEWPITSRTTLQDGLYHYDAIGRLHDVAVKQKQNVPISDLDSNIGDFITLGPLGTALVPRARPRLLLIDEFDKSDYDLPNDLLFILEKGEFEIPELKRIKEHNPAVKVRLHNSDAKYTVKDGKLACADFPLIVITSNEERELPPPFLRRCIRLKMASPDEEQLLDIVEKHLEGKIKDVDRLKDLIKMFNDAKEGEDNRVATDQLLNAAYLMTQDLGVSLEFLRAAVLKPLK